MAAEQTEREHQSLDALLSDFRKYGTIEEEGVGINDADGLREHLIDKLVFDAVFGDKDVMAVSRWLIWETAQTLGTGPASIHEYYMAGGQGAWSNRTTPAINIRGITYEVARTIFKARKLLTSASRSSKLPGPRLVTPSSGRKNTRRSSLPPRSKRDTRDQSSFKETISR
ncbi:MAG: hypothetical protein R2849_08720 [Thermomicrobiales bacterium]